MTELVDPQSIEGIVGVPRHPYLHIGRHDESTQTVFILHSQRCVDSGIDLRECRFSISLDEGIDPRIWFCWGDVAVILSVLIDGNLAPVADAAVAADETWTAT